MSGRKVHQHLMILRKNKVAERPLGKISYTSLDKYDKRSLQSKRANQNEFSLPKKTAFNQKTEFKQDNKTDIIKGEKIYRHDDWPKTNKRRYLQNYQLPKLDSPSRRRDLEEYQMTKEEVRENESLDRDQLELKKRKQKVGGVTIEYNTSPKKMKLMPLKKENNFHSVSRTKAGTNGKTAKINQDIVIIETKFHHGLKLFSVCDGHGLNGHLVSAFIKANLIKNLTAALKKTIGQEVNLEKMQDIIFVALAKTNQQILDSDINTELAGSTVVTTFIYKNYLLTFNIGDSRAILLKQKPYNYCQQKEEEQHLELSHSTKKEKYDWSIIQLSIDQKPERPDERDRIIKNGGRVFSQKDENGDAIGPLRVWMKDVMMPGLAMTRSFGDKAGIKAGTNGQPELIVHELLPEDKYIIIASDGVWEYLENFDVMRIVLPFLTKEDPNGAADALMKASIQIWTRMNYARDDITLVLVKVGDLLK